MEAHPDVNEKVLIPGLEIPRNTTMNTSAILDEPILNDKTPVLQPTPNCIAKSIQKTKNFGNWLLDYIQPKPKVIDEALESFKNRIKKLYNKRDTSFQLRESKSTLKEFAIQRRIDGKHWIVHDSFCLTLSSLLQIFFMINTRQTKVKLSFSCTMEKVDLKSGEVTAKEAAFLSKTEVILESTNFNELFSTMKETVFDSLVKFKRQGSNWRFHSVLSLDLHTVKYEPLGGSSYIPLPGFLAAKKAIINLKSKGEERFKWAIRRALNPVEKN